MKNDRTRVVVLGSGFASLSFLRVIDNKRHHLTVVSPRNHFLFTPLLPSTTVGTLEFRSIVESVRTVCPDAVFHQAEAIGLDTLSRTLECRTAFDASEFRLPYDRLIIGVGATANTFDLPGVREHTHFLKELSDAHSIREHILECFERAAQIRQSEAQRQRILHFVVIGGGPTGVEFAAELHDFIAEDLRRPYKELIQDVRITIVEAGPTILTTFDGVLRAYTMKIFRRNRINVRTSSPVIAVRSGDITLADGSTLEYGMAVWTVGIAPVGFVQRLPLAKDESGRLLTDERLCVKGLTDVFAAGDCMAIEGRPFPSTAQTAQQQGAYLARAFNRRGSEKHVPRFRYRHYGMLAYVGSGRALADLESVKGKGFAAWLFWRSAYVTRIVSLKNKTLVLFDWLKTAVFGRDLSRF